ncbi:hypothetical protein [Oceanisphaera avium]|nr:hypothetical protein [Oceanisphaera avium]
MEYNAVARPVAPQVGAHLSPLSSRVLTAEPCMWSADDTYPAELLNQLQQHGEPLATPMSLGFEQRII